MSRICNNCGNTQHENEAISCSVCGHDLVRDTGIALGLTVPPHQIRPLSSGSNLSQMHTFSILTDKGQRCRFTSDSDVIIGSGDGCAIRLSDPEVNRQHARFYQQDGLFFIQALMASRIFVNGRLLDHLPRQINLPDQIKIGRSTLMIVRDDKYPTIPQAEPREAIIPYPNTKSPNIVSDNSDLSGFVRHVDGPFMEDPDSTVASNLATAAKVGLTIWKPGLGMLLSHSRQIQVRYYRVQGDNGETHAVRMKGNISTGMISIGDHVSFWGNWKGGTLHMSRAFNNTLGTNVELSKRK